MQRRGADGGNRGLRVMEAVVGLLLVLLRVSHGVDPYCDGRRGGAVCYGALGGSLVLQLMDDASQIWSYKWENETRIIMSGKKSTITINNVKERSHFTPQSGLFRINNLTRVDSSNYTLVLYHEDYKKMADRKMTLTIQAPVTSVQLTNECLPLGNKRLNCSSEDGDSPEYNWTLNGRTLTDDQLLHGTGETNSVTLKLPVLGNLNCLVRNRISNVSKSVELTTCGYKFIECALPNGTEISEWVREDSDSPCVGPTTASVTSGGKENGTGSVTLSNNITSFNQTGTPSADEQWYINVVAILAGALAALAVLIVVFVAVNRKWIKKQNDKTKEEEDEEELTYADVRSVQLRARPMPPTSDVGVEYGQVRFTERPRHTEASGDHCVYTNVQTVR